MSGERADHWEVAPFGCLQIAYAASVLPPRAWTVAQSSWAVELLACAAPGPILELCTGSGQIGLLAAVRSGRPLVGIDVNQDAVTCARYNARRAGIADRVDLRCADLAAALVAGETYPLIIADPPWVEHRDVGRYPLDPPLAIDGGADGLQLARECVEVIADHLREDGAALLQFGSRDQASRLVGHLSANAVDLRVTEQRDFPGCGHLVLLERPARRHR